MRWMLKCLFNGVGFRAWLKDWRRGWDENDLNSALAKLSGPHNPGGYIEVTHRELEALTAQARGDRFP
jgi:hypothetical protein